MADLHARDASRPGKPDYTRREFDLLELLDEPCSYAEWKAASLDLARLNRLTGAYNPALAFLRRAVARVGARSGPLHVVDVGCGHGDTLRTLYKWAGKNGVALKLTGIDTNPYTARLAQERDREEGLSVSAISWVVGDVFTWQPQQLPDLVLSSLVAHHLSDLELPLFMQWCEEKARLGWLMTDLVRSARAATLVRWLVTLLGMHSFLRHDAPISFRRALTEEEWALLLWKQGLMGTAEFMGAGRGRIAIERFR